MAARVVIACEELRRLYLEEGIGVAGLARRLGCSAPTVSNRLRACAIPTRSGRFRPREIPRELLERLYAEEGLAVRAIAQRLGVSISTIYNRRRAYGIPLRHRRAAAAGELEGG